MITNLFSIFDPSASTFSLSWSIIVLIYTIVPSLSNSKNTNNTTYFINTIFESLNNETSLLFNENPPIIYNDNSNQFEKTFPVALGAGIALINISALYPHIFPMTSQLTITLALAVFHWLWTSFLPGWINNTNHTLSHLVPQGTPTPLINFIVLIELTSSVIRPITLCVRLTANIIAGHLLITLLGNMIMLIPNTTPATIFLPLILTVLETAVAIIQAYVFITLTALYIEETI